MKNDLDTKIQIVRVITELMHRKKDYHLQADLYKLTNRSLSKLLRTLEAKQTKKIKESEN